MTLEEQIIKLLNPKLSQPEITWTDYDNTISEVLLKEGIIKGDPYSFENLLVIDPYRYTIKEKLKLHKMYGLTDDYLAKDSEKCSEEAKSDIDEFDKLKKDAIETFQKGYRETPITEGALENKMIEFAEKYKPFSQLGDERKVTVLGYLIDFVSEYINLTNEPTNNNGIL